MKTKLFGSFHVHSSETYYFLHSATTEICSAKIKVQQNSSLAVHQLDLYSEIFQNICELVQF